MNLPTISLPLSLPIDIPLLAHPPLTHFAIVLPILIILIELINSFIKSRTLSGISFTMIIGLVVVLLGTFLTGKSDASEVFSALSTEAQEAVKAHKLLGIYIVYASVGLLVFKILNFTKLKVFKVLFILVMILFTATVLEQGEEGGKLVYEHGVNVAAMADLKDSIDEYKDEIDELKEDNADLKEKLEEASTKKVEKPVEEAVEEAVEKPVEEAVEKPVETTQESVTPAPVVENNENNTTN